MTRGDRSIPRAAWWIVAAAVPFHALLAVTTELSPDEAYYLCAARRPALLAPLVDHPPLLPWLLRLSDRGALPLELRVRVWPILFSLATAVACVLLARRRGATDAGCVLAALVSAWALLPTAGGFIATPDGPALLAVALALLAVGDALTPRRAALAALALALGALAKVVLLPIALLLALTAPAPPRALALRAALALSPLLALPLLLPSLRFQLAHAFAQRAAEGWSLLGAANALLAALAAQLLLWSPYVLAHGARALSLRADLPRPDRAVVLALSALVAASALLRAVPPEPNWWAPAALVLVVAFARAPLDPTRARRAVLLTVLLPTLLAAAHAARPFLPLPERADPTARLHGWKQGEQPPTEAAGVGPYGPAAERCVHQNDCSEIRSYFEQMELHQ